MPTLQLLHDSNVTSRSPKPPPQRGSAHQRQRLSALQHMHIYSALVAILLAIFFVRFAARRLQYHFPSWIRRPRRSELRRKPESSEDPESHEWTTTTLSNKPLFFRPGVERTTQTAWAAGLLASPADQVRTGLTPSVLGMEEQKDQPGSRGVSTSPVGSAHPDLGAHPRADTGSKKTSCSPRSRQSRSSPRRYSNSSDGSAGTKLKGRGKGPMDGDSWGGNPTHNPADTPMLAAADGAMQDGEHDHGASASASMFSRPIPPPPLTPPTLYTGSFAFEDRRPSYAVSIPAPLDTSFIHQPNPDYMSASAHGGSPKSTTTTPRRRSYTKTVPIGIPAMPSGSSSSSSHPSQNMAWGVSSTDTLSPASYPPSSPQLPPPPPGAYDEMLYDYDGQGEINLQGEIISVMDDAGHGWKRHTRVYGGGVCLACIAAGDRQGGFYGDKVPLSERR